MSAIAAEPLALDATLDLPWLDRVVAGRLALPWTRAVVAGSAGQVSARAWRLRVDGRDRGVGIVHVVHRVNLAAYMGRAATAIARGLGAVGLHPLRMDIAFCELPLLHLSGLLAAPDASAGERLGLQEALVAAARRALDVDLLVVRVAPGAPEARALGLPLVPFYDDHVMPVPDHADWLAARARKRLRHSLRKAARHGATIRVHEGAVPAGDVLHPLYAETLGRNAGEIAHPIAVTPRLLDAIAALPEHLRAIVTVDVDDRPVAFTLLLNAGPAALGRTTGVDRARGQPVDAYFAMQSAWVEVPARWGCAELDLGPTAAAVKQRLGTTPRPTGYLVDFRRWWLRPARRLLARPAG